MKRGRLESALLWAKNTTVDLNKIATHFGLSGKQKVEFEKAALEVRKG